MHEGERDWRRTVARGVALALVLGSLGIVGMVVYAGGVAPVFRAAERLGPAAAAAIGLTAIAWWVDALRYPVMARQLELAQPLRTWLAVALVNQFGSFAVSAGPPAAGYVLARRGVDGAKSFALALAKQSLFVPAVLAPVCVFVIVDPSLARGTAFLAGLWSAGLIGMVTMVCVIAIAVAPTATSRVLARLRIPEASRAQFVSALSTIFRAPSVLALSLVLALVEQAAIAAIVVVLAAGVGCELDAGLCVRALVFSGVSQAAPTPAGAGISEVAGAWLFAPLASAPAVVAFVVLWRFLVLQLPIVVGGILLARAASRRS